MKILAKEELQKSKMIVCPKRITVIEVICHQNHFDKDIQESAVDILYKIKYYDPKLIDELATSFVAVYLACKEKGIKTSIEEIGSKYNPFNPGLDRTHQANLCKALLGRTKKHLKKIQKLMPKINKKKWKPEKKYKNSEIREINYIVSANNLNDMIAKKARQIYNNSCHLSEGELCGTFPPACVYLACQSFADTMHITLEELLDKTYPPSNLPDNNLDENDREYFLGEVRKIIKKIIQNQA